MTINELYCLLTSDGGDSSDNGATSENGVTSDRGAISNRGVNFGHFPFLRFLKICKYV